jgi:acetyl esterase/lipase
MRSHLLPLLTLLALAALAARIAAQTPAPTVNDLVWATVPLDGGGTTQLRLDFWHATSGADRAPLAIWIHGGAWLGGSYNSAPPGLAAFLNAGFAVASIQYRFSTQAIFPAQIHDVKGAVRFFRAHADEYDLDPSRFAAWGSSAGGHLVALVATSGDVAALEGTTGGNLNHSSSLEAAVDYFGPTDLLVMNLDVTTPPGSVIDHDDPNSPESQLIGFDAAGQGVGVLRANIANPAPPFPEKAALIQSANPITFVDADDPPMFIAHGTVDNVVPQKQSQRLVDALAAVNVDRVYRPVVGAGHGFGSQSATVDAEAIAFLTEHVMQPAGDFNRDGAVDGRDFLAWQAEFGSTPAIRGLGADGNVDGVVDENDLPIWHANLGATSSPAAAKNSPAPEPGAAALLAAPSIALAQLRRRGRTAVDLDLCDPVAP